MLSSCFFRWEMCKTSLRSGYRRVWWGGWGLQAARSPASCLARRGYAGGHRGPRPPHPCACSGRASDQSGARHHPVRAATPPPPRWTSAWLLTGFPTGTSSSPSPGRGPPRLCPDSSRRTDVQLLQAPGGPPLVTAPQVPKAADT